MAEAPLDLAWRLLRALPAWAAYRIVHSFPYSLRGPAGRLLRGRCPEPLQLDPGLGVELANPVGLAAGLDKDGNLTWLGDALCLGFTVVGSVLPRKHPGARRKLLIRLAGESAVNRLGLPSRGARAVAGALRSYRPRYARVAVNIAALEPEGYAEAARIVGPLGGWVEVNISCPNTREHGTFESPMWAERIARTVRSVLPQRVGVLVKIPHTTDRDLLSQYVEAARRAGVQGLVAGNTSKFWVRGVQAGLSGAAIYHVTRRMIEILSDMAWEGMVLVAAGGVTRPERAVELLELGASLVEVLTALLRLGPGRVREIVWEAWRWAGRR